MPKVIYEDITYDSQEELDFKHWCDEAVEAGLMTSHSMQVKGVDTMELVGKQYYTVNGREKHCFSAVKYTPDRLIVSNMFTPFCEKELNESHHYLDIKGAFSPHHDNKQFQIIRKMVYKFKGIYIHKVVPHELFKKTWVPELCRYTDVKKDIKNKFKNTPTISEYLKNREK